MHLKSDLFDRAIRSGPVGRHLPVAASQNEALTGVATDAAIGYARNGGAVVRDGIVGPCSSIASHNRSHERASPCTTRDPTRDGDHLTEAAPARAGAIDSVAAECVAQLVARLGEGGVDGVDEQAAGPLGISSDRFVIDRLADRVEHVLE